MKFSFALFLASSLLLQGALGELVCEDLPKERCSFSIESSGKRCVLEKFAGKDGKTEFQCKTSEVVVERMANYIETDKCVAACGVDRNSVGISSDSLIEPQFTAKLCSPACYDNCPNIVDLYFNLAAGEGVSLSALCELQRRNPHRAMVELLSSGVAAGPLPSDPLPIIAGAPGPVTADAPSDSFDALGPVSPGPSVDDADAPAPAFI